MDTSILLKGFCVENIIQNIMQEYNDKRCEYCGIKLKYLTVCDMCARRQKIIQDTMGEIKNQIEDDWEYKTEEGGET